MLALKRNDIETLRILEDVYKGWTPNRGQVLAGKALFIDGKKTLFIRWGRKGGKTEFVDKAIKRIALCNPRSGCYYFCPQANQAREILWETGRLQKSIPSKYIKSIRSNDMRIVLTNGSFVKLDGSDNYEKHRGTEPHFLTYDEFKDFDKRFHEAIDPNRGVYDAPLVIVGTPPVSINEDRNYEQYMELQKQCMVDEDKFYLKVSSFVNCHNIPLPDPKLSMKERIERGKAFLYKKRQELIDRGEEYRWKIEYLAENVAMGKNAVFPMISKRNVVPLDLIHEDLKKDQHKLDWYCIADPGTSTVFGVLFICLNPYTRQIWILDEIYEKDRCETATRNILKSIVKKMKFLAPELDPEDNWIKIFDEAAPWFMNEAENQRDKKLSLTFNPTQKYYNKKENGLALMKECLLYKTAFMTDRCPNLYWEMEQYTCIDGKYPKHHDHLIDDFRYFLADSGYDMVEALEAKKKPEKRSRLLPTENELRSKDIIETDLDEDWTEVYD